MGFHNTSVKNIGADAVVWVKEKKLIPNAPPDFVYVEDKSKDLYGLIIADAFLEDSGLYFCHAFGAQGTEITCWCEVDVLGNSFTHKLNHN